MIKVIFTLFNLQGTALCRRSCADSVILPHSPPFVKNFFRGFSRNFHAPLLGRILRFSQQFHPNFIGLCRFLLPLSRALGYTIIPFPICQLLFSGFFKKVFGPCQNPICDGSVIDFHTVRVPVCTESYCIPGDYHLGLRPLTMTVVVGRWYFCLSRAVILPDRWGQCPHTTGYANRNGTKVVPCIQDSALRPKKGLLTEPLGFYIYYGVSSIRP